MNNVKSVDKFLKMDVESIKPKDNSIRYYKMARSEYDKLFEEYQKRLGPERMLIPRRCPACNSNQHEILYKKFRLNYVRCKCGMVYITPYLSKEFKRNWYEKSKSANWFFREVVIKNRENRMKNIWKIRVEKLTELGLPLDKVLDIGCGSGEFIELMYLKGHTNTLGIEPGQVPARFAKERLGDSIIHGFFEFHDFPERNFSLITLWEVFHHFWDPLESAKKLCYLLREGGSLVISSPNIEGLDYVVMRENHHDITFEICNYFNPETITRVLMNAGFNKNRIDITTPGKLDMQYILRGVEIHGLGIIKDFFVRNVIKKIHSGDLTIADDLQNFLVQHGLSGSMFVLARK